MTWQQARFRSGAVLPMMLLGASSLTPACGGSSTDGGVSGAGGAKPSGGAGATGGHTAGAGGAAQAGRAGSSGTGVGGTQGVSGTSGASTAGGRGGDVGEPAGAPGAGADNESGAGGLPQGGAGGTGGTGGAGEGGAAGSHGGSSGQVGTLGADCSPPGAVACAGNHQKITLVCGAEQTWEVNETCDVSEFCDSTPGPSAGLCREPEALCVDSEPGERFCGDGDARVCDADGLTSRIVEACPYLCVDGQCDDSCAAGVLMNCTTECGGPTDCNEVCGPGPAASRPPPLLFEADEIEPGVRYTLKVPAAPNDDLCQDNCGGTFPAVGQIIPVRLPVIPGHPFYRIEAPSPWFLALMAYPAGASVCDDAGWRSETITDDTFDCEIIEWSERYAENAELELQLWISVQGVTSTPAIITLEAGTAESFEACPL